MNQKRARILRRMAEFKPSTERVYRKTQVDKRNPIDGALYKAPGPILTSGARDDYQKLKQYMKGQDVLLSSKLQIMLDIDCD
jgi:hypothetical protein